MVSIRDGARSVVALSSAKEGEEGTWLVIALVVIQLTDSRLYSRDMILVLRMTENDWEVIEERLQRIS